MTLDAHLPEPRDDPDASTSSPPPACTCGQQLVDGIARLLDLANARRDPWLYTFQEVAELMGVGLRVIEDRGRRLEFAFVSFGKSRLLTQEQLDALIAKFTVQPAEVTSADEEIEARRRARTRSGRRRRSELP
ncbi:hypothetical protein [Dactylosporangium sp. CA-139066]|uniref:hypothetical protein n=1 Tax=Dactylosporangium sp. CA-139066 TaxID=3239930 RepID=UPI003D8E201E